MSPQHTLPSEVFNRPLFPEDRDQGDPFVLRVPEEASAEYRFYVYTTGQKQSRSGFACSVYGSPNLVEWHYLRDSLIVEPRHEYWAPCVRYVPTLPEPYVMLYSKSKGLGNAAHQHHVIRRAVSPRPEGPFQDSGHALTPHLDFSIDPDVYQGPDGTLYMAFATDHIHDEPYGTGIAEARISDDLTTLLGETKVLARASSKWHLYNRRRRITWKDIPGVDWTNPKASVRWHTVEGPVGGLISPQGRRVYLYSGGNYSREYAIGVLVENDEGELVDVGRDGHHFVLQAQPQKGFFAPGHCSVVQGLDDALYVMYHARYGSAKPKEAPRQMSLAPLLWTEAGFPYCPTL